ncbi:MAG: hypothetical protein R3A13_10535 [Bdellovibrionota bacterium]
MVTTNLQLINSDPARIQADITRSELDPKVERTRLLDELGLHFPDNSPRDLVRLVIDRRSDLKINGHIIQTIIDGEGWLHARKLERLIEQDVQIEARHFKLLIPAQAQILSSLMWAEEEDSLVTKAIQDLTAKIESSGGSAEDIEEKIDYESTMIRRISFIKKLAAVLEIGEKFVEAQLNQGAPYASLKSELYNKLIARAGFYPESIGKVVDNFLTNNYDELGYVFLDTTLELVAAYNNLRRPSDPDLTASEVFSLLQPSLENEFLELFYDSRAITLQTEFTADFPRA